MSAASKQKTSGISVTAENNQNSNINVAGGHIRQTINNSQKSGEVEALFTSLLAHIEKLPPGDTKKDANQALEGLKQEAAKGGQAEESRVERWLKFLVEAAPDIKDVAVKTFLNPVDGLSEVFRKVAKRVQQQK